MIKKIFKLIYSIILFSISFIYVSFTKIFRKKDNKKIWLISELENMARDSGIAFYDYCMEQKSSEVCAYYVINFNCQDYKSIKNKDNLIRFYSLRHYVMYLKADALITCFQDAICPSAILEKLLRKLGLLKNKKVFLQHGIIKDYIPMLTKDNYDVDMFVTTTKDEYDYVVNNYGYEKETIKLVGLPRYDYLDDKSTLDDVKILIMPTWRRWIKNDIINTEFYKKYSELINLLTDKYKNNKNIEVYFYLHNNFQKFADAFKGTDKVKILSSDDYKVNELFNCCNVMITDYSSVAFDFTYLNKPIIYYQFDTEKLRKSHYEEGYFSYEENGFGPVFIEAEEIGKHLDKLSKNNFKNLKKYEKRSNNFFKYRDRNNRKRNFDEIMKLCK